MFKYLLVKYYVDSLCNILLINIFNVARIDTR